MSEFTSETTDAAQEEVEGVHASPEETESNKNVETLGASTPGANDALEKDPSDLVSGDDPMTESQKSYLDTLARQAGEELPATINTAEASHHLDRLKTQLNL